MPSDPQNNKNTIPPQSPTNAAAAQRRSKAFGTFLLAAGLSGVLLALLAAYLVVAPQPVVRPDVNAPMPVDPAFANIVRFVAPRSVITPDLLRDFETENNVTVELIPYDDEETLGAANASSLLNGDVILVAGTTIKVLTQQDRLNVLPARAIDHLGQIDPALRTLATQYDQGGLHAVPFAWTSYGLGLNREAVAAKLGASALRDTWGLLFDPTQAAKLAACGIHGVTAPSIAFPVALTYLQLPPVSDAPNDTERASALWETVRPYMAAFETRSVVENLSSGRVCVALAAASDVYQARAMARDVGQSFTLDFVSPREGAFMRTYMLAMPRFGKNPPRAVGLINYLLRADVSARMTNSRWLANAVPASQLYVRQDIKDDPVVYPDVGAFKSLIPETTPAPATVSLRERFWLLMSTTPKAP